MGQVHQRLRLRLGNYQEVHNFSSAAGSLIQEASPDEEVGGREPLVRTLVDPFYLTHLGPAVFQAVVLLSPVPA